MSKITITMSFDSIDDLRAVMGFNNIDELQAALTAKSQTQVNNSSRKFDSDYLPAIGTSVHWAGARFNFYGVVERLNTDDDPDLSGKLVWVRRNDTGKLVSLTGDDLDENGVLTAI